MNVTCHVVPLVVLTALLLLAGCSDAGNPTGVSGRLQYSREIGGPSPVLELPPIDRNEDGIICLRNFETGKDLPRAVAVDNTNGRCPDGFEISIAS